MKIKLTPLYLLSFFTLVFLVHELHDWAHTITAWSVCGCWGPRAFDFWDFCSKCTATSPYPRVLAWITGPLINYILIWAGWGLMHPENPIEKRSLGFALVFATLPLVRILGALAGGGDETFALRQLFQHADGGNRHNVALAGLLIVLILNLPPLIRAFLLFPGWLGKIGVFAAFLILPGPVDRWVNRGMNHLLTLPSLSHQWITGISVLVVAWFFIMLFLFALSYKRLEGLFEHQDLPL